MRDGCREKFGGRHGRVRQNEARYDVPATPGTSLRYYGPRSMECGACGPRLSRLAHNCFPSRCAHFPVFLNNSRKLLAHEPTKLFCKESTCFLDRRLVLFYVAFLSLSTLPLLSSFVRSSFRPVFIPCTFPSLQSHSVQSQR